MQRALICSLLMAFPAVVADSESIRDVPLKDAIRLAETFMQEQKIDTSSCYLNTIQFDATYKMVGESKQIDEAYWALWWVKPGADLKESFIVAVSVKTRKVWRMPAPQKYLEKPHLTRMPTVPLPQAIGFAQLYAAGRGRIDLSEYHLFDVSVMVGSHCASGSPCWQLWWCHNDEALDHYIFIYVSLDGQVSS